MPALGTFVLLAAFVTCAYAIAASVAGARRRSTRLVESGDREAIKARIGAAGTPLYAAHPDRPGTVVEIQSDGTRTPDRLEGRRFRPTGGKTAPRRT